ncbi:hypothetical protein GN244_ATG18472 [Phytophthora infestans]|uniref:Uncharacterized protein n=1 Tax=Phytophthora infestans TaxID=4787 RepID=A0A833WK15_PHYIN|nr:hypothetical protein GN244_ATG18472 [Phytophthora infestans]
MVCSALLLNTANVIFCDLACCLMTHVALVPMWLARWRFRRICSEWMWAHSSLKSVSSCLSFDRSSNSNMTRNWRLSDPHAELPIKNHEYIQELGGLDGCFRLKQINAQNNCIRIIQVVVVPFVARLVCSSSGKL